MQRMMPMSGMGLGGGLSNLGGGGFGGSGGYGSGNTFSGMGGYGGGASNVGGQSESVVLEEEFDPDYDPTEEEIIEYAQFLGMHLEEDKDLLWIAKEGLKAPLPEPWKPCKTEDNEVYYFNFDTGESVWEHPCDEFYKKQYLEEKEKKMRNGGVVPGSKEDQKKKKKDKKEKKKKKKEKEKEKESQVVLSVPVGGGKALGQIGGIGKKPLGGLLPTTIDNKPAHKIGSVESASDSDMEKQAAQEASDRKKLWEEEKKQIIGKEAADKEEWQTNRKKRMNEWKEEQEEDYKIEMDILQKQWKRQKEEKRAEATKMEEKFDSLLQETEQKIKATEAKHQEELAALQQKKTQQEKEVEAEISKIKARIAEEKQTFESEWEQEKKSKLAANSKELLAAKSAECEKELAEMEKAHSAKLEQLKKDHNQALETAKADHAKEIDAQKESQSSEVTKLNEEHTKRISALQATHSKEIQELEQANQDKIGQFKKSIQSDNVGASNLEEQIQDLESQLAAAKNTAEVAEKELKVKQSLLEKQARDLQDAVQSTRSEKKAKEAAQQALVAATEKEGASSSTAECSECKQLKKKIEKLETAIGDGDEELEEAKERGDAMEREVHRQSALIKQLRQEAKDRSSNAVSDDGKLHSLQDALAAAEKQLEQERQGRDKDKDRLESQLVSLTDQLKRAESQGSEVPDQTKIKDLQRDVKRLSRENEDLVAALEEEKADRAEEVRKLKVANRLPAVASSAEDNAQKIAELEDEVDSLRTALTKERGEKKKEKERVKEEFAMELESAKAQAHASKGSADELRKLKWEFQVLKDETSSDKKQLSLTLDAEKDKLRQKEREISRQSSKIGMLEDEVARLTADLESERTEREAEVDRMAADLAKEKERIRSERDRSLARTSSSSSDAQLQKELDSLRAEVAALEESREKDRKAARKREQALRKEVQAEESLKHSKLSEKSLRKKEKELNQLQQRLEDEQDERAALASKLAEAEKQLSRASSERMQWEREKERLESAHRLADKQREREREEEKQKDFARQKERDEEREQQKFREREREEEQKFRERILNQGKGIGERERERERQRERERAAEKEERARREKERSEEAEKERQRQSERLQERARQRTWELEREQLQEKIRDLESESKRSREDAKQRERERLLERESEAHRERERAREVERASEKEREMAIERSELRELVSTLERELETQRDRQRKSDAERKREREALRGKDADLGKEVEKELERLREDMLEREREIKNEKKKWLAEKEKLKMGFKEKELARLTAEENERVKEKRRAQKEMREAFEKLNQDHKAELLQLQERLEKVANCSKPEDQAESNAELSSQIASLSRTVKSLSAQLSAKEREIAQLNDHLDAVAASAKSANAVAAGWRNRLQDENSSPRKDINQQEQAGRWAFKTAPAVGNPSEDAKWEQRLAAEKEMVRQVKGYLHEQREIVRKLQKSLQTDQDRWKWEKRTLDLNNANSEHKDKVARLKARKSKLQAEAKALNSDIRQLRAIQQWIERKEKILLAFEKDLLLLRRQEENPYSDAGEVSASKVSLERQWHAYLLTEGTDCGDPPESPAKRRTHSPIRFSSPQQPQFYQPPIVDSYVPVVKAAPAATVGIKPYSDVQARVSALQSMLQRWSSQRTTALQGSLQSHFNFLKGFSEKISLASHNAKLSSEMFPAPSQQPLQPNLNYMQQSQRRNELLLTPSRGRRNSATVVMSPSRGIQSAYGDGPAAESEDDKEFVIRIKVDR